MTYWLLMPRSHPGFHVPEGGQLRATSLLPTVLPGLPPPVTAVQRPGPPRSAAPERKAPDSRGHTSQLPQVTEAAVSGTSVPIVSITLFGRAYTYS